MTSGGVYGYRKVTVDLREPSQTCSRHGTHQLMQIEDRRAEVGLGSKSRDRDGRLGVAGGLLNLASHRVAKHS